MTRVTALVTRWYTWPAETLVLPLTDLFILQLKASKMDSFWMGCPITLTPSAHSVCAVRTMAHQLAGNSTPLYFFSTGKFFTRDKVTSILHFQLQHLGFARVLCISEFPHWGCKYCCRGQLAPLTSPNPWLLVQQLPHSIHQDTCFNTPRSLSPASRQP